ncbi:hypothetical protein V1509DRAFT_65579 [Lipomyces kononenkoae]
MKCLEKSCKWHRYNALEFTELLDELYAPSMATGGYATTLVNRPSDSPFLDPFLRCCFPSESNSTPSGPLRNAGELLTPRRKRLQRGFRCSCWRK